MSELLFSQRILNTEPSFIVEILKVTKEPNVISFAGGLPSSASFPEQQIAGVCSDLIDNHKNILQYSTSDGNVDLRTLIIDRYKKLYGIDIALENIIITSGSQQGLDLISKVFIDKGDKVTIEDPGYLGAIQTFSMFEPEIVGIPFNKGELDLDILSTEIQDAKLFYTVPSYQNPTGLTIDNERRKKIAQIIKDSGKFIIEDNPYGELAFENDKTELFYSLIPDNTVLLGSSSKTIAPGLRIGWLIAGKEVIEALTIAKQSSDLHTNTLTQQILVDYLQNNDLDKQIQQVCQMYKKQRDVMIDALSSSEILSDISYQVPKGGMFLWAELPENLSSKDLLNFALEEKILFVPGEVFAISADVKNAMRLNFSYLEEDNIREGVARLERAYTKYLASLI